MEPQVASMNIKDMSALDFISAVLDEIEASEGTVALQFEENGPLVFCSVGSLDDIDTPPTSEIH